LVCGNAGHHMGMPQMVDELFFGYVKIVSGKVVTVAGV
jgi:hypothetical protein